ncbi:hypothetical protein SAMN05216548_102129 [Faunimonas pinastri]|uniref:Sulfotransferase family protein n=1 Tax=Faunimonas pinastri TaxID=1855383 RepID=A0A1H9CET6_9HYPH|nr:sulfotransferase family protein [Faunimonas pinastri]SEP99527.1 hypothetical protein SAMN05216548_102129 [Faunimonas pinastri]
MHKVFGIGLNKTGTSTLGECLMTLGYRHVSFRSDMLGHWTRRHFTPILDETEKFDSFEDWPWPLLFKEFYWRYGDRARFVLTRRSSPEVWVESLKKHSLNTHPDRPMRPVIYGYKYPHGREREHVAFYERHNAEARAFFAREAPHLLLELCWEDGDRWDKLCAFLGHPVPDAPFPHIKPRSTGVDPRIRDANARNIEAQLAAIEREGS